MPEHMPCMQPGVKLKVWACGRSKYGCSTVTCHSKSMHFYSYPSASFIQPASDKNVNIRHTGLPWYPTSYYCHSTPQRFCLVNSKPHNNMPPVNVSKPNTSPVPPTHQSQHSNSNQFFVQC